MAYSMLRVGLNLFLMQKKKYLGVVSVFPVKKIKLYKN